MRTILLLIALVFFSCSKNLSKPNSTFGDGSTLDVITWNIEYFPKNSLTIDTITPIIKDLQVDIFALQEITNQEAFLNLANNLGEYWIGYRSENSDYGEPAFLVNTLEIEIIDEPYQILEEYSSYPENYFSYREPYVLEFIHKEISYVIINIHYKCCGDGEINFYNEDDEEYRRYQSSIFLEEYINEHFSNKNVILLGDFNDQLSDIEEHNVFMPFLNKQTKYDFTDYYIEDDNDISFFSYPTWPSHLDHILISNELFDKVILTKTIRVEDQMPNGWDDYESIISDHRPVGIIIN
tara:strand:- start:443 stop:1327 length:885 start_codon:yes stop_codon:yes gene_type:complete